MVKGLQYLALDASETCHLVGERVTFTHTRKDRSDPYRSIDDLSFRADRSLFCMICMA